MIVKTKSTINGCELEVIGENGNEDTLLMLMSGMGNGGVFINEYGGNTGMKSGGEGSVGMVFRFVKEVLGK